MAAFSSPSQRARDAAGGSRSSPALAAAFRLEKISFGKKLIAMEYTKVPERFPLETIKDRDRRRRVEEQVEKMRQRDEKELGLAASELKREKILQRREREKRLEAERKAEDLKCQEMVKKWKLEQAIIADRERERAEIQRKAAEEKERKHAQEAELDRVRRIPVVCRTCDGNGMCQECKGTGVHQATFLSPKIEKHPLEFGTKKRGCEGCFGCNQGIRGELKQGNGTCSTCAGVGKFCTGWCSRPISPITSPFSRSRSRHANQDWPSSEKAPEKESAVAEQPATNEVCGSCGGGIRPSLEEAERLWDSLGVATA